MVMYFTEGSEMKIATVGSSWITEKFLSGALGTGKIELEAVYSRSEEKGRAFAQKYGKEKIYTSLEEMANDGTIDGVYIASPNRLHFEQSMHFLTHGKNVICEKPATTTESEMREVIKTAKNRNLIYTEAIMPMYVPAFSTLKSAVDEIGKIRICNIVYCQLSSKYPALLRGENPNIFNPEMHTGALADIGVYNVFVAAGLFGEPNKITSKCTFLDTGADGQGTAILTYGDMSVNLIFSKVGQSYSPSEIIGDEGTISIGSVSLLTGIDLTQNGERKNLVPENISRDEIMGAEASAFADAVNGCADAIGKIDRVNETALIVRRICDEIRRQNSFPF